MQPIEKLLLVAGFGRSMYGNWRFQRVLSDALTVTALAVIAIMLAGMLMVGGFYAAYHILSSYGLEEMTILLIAGLFIFFCIVALVKVIRNRICKMKAVVTSPLGEAVDAFMRGLLAAE